MTIIRLDLSGNGSNGYSPLNGRSGHGKVSPGSTEPLKPRRDVNDIILPFRDFIDLVNRIESAFIMQQENYGPLDLSGIDFTYLNKITNIDRSPVNLEELLIAIGKSQKPLVNVNLQGAILDGVNLEGADMEGANLSETSMVRTNLTRANLETANLIGADLSGAILEEANLYGAYAEDYDRHQLVLELQLQEYLERMGAMVDRSTKFTELDI